MVVKLSDERGEDPRLAEALIQVAVRGSTAWWLVKRPVFMG